MGADLVPWILAAMIIGIGIALLAKRKGTAILVVIVAFVLVGAVTDFNGTVGALLDSLRITLSGD